MIPSSTVRWLASAGIRSGPVMQRSNEIDVPPVSRLVADEARAVGCSGVPASSSAIPGTSVQSMTDTS